MYVCVLCTEEIGAGVEGRVGRKGQENPSPPNEPDLAVIATFFLTNT